MVKNRNLTILLYHGVTPFTSFGVANYSGKHISLEVFDEHMYKLQKCCNVLTIDDVVMFVKQGMTWPENAVAVTFDDGFKNNFQFAAPILEKYKIPAVFYICAGMVGTDKMFWVDQIEDCFNLTSQSMIEIQLDKRYQFDLTSARMKIVALDKVKQFCKNNTAKEKNRVLTELSDECAVIPNVTHSINYEMMSWDEVITMDKNPLFTIGGHTLYHDIMTSQAITIVDEDAKETLALLEAKLGHPVCHFAYPEGQAHHYSQSVINLLKKRGIICCPSAIEGINPPGADLFHLKRIMPGFMNREFPISLS